MWKWFCYIRNYVWLRFFHVKTGKNLKIRGILNLGWKVNLEIGDNVTINSGWRGNPNPIKNEVITSLVTVYDGKIRIGNNVGMSNCCIYARERVEVEDDVYIGGGCTIFDTDFHPLKYEDRIIDDESKVLTSPVRICKGAFIGAGTYITKGVAIGERSVVGAGSVVTKSIPSDEVWAGNPARFIKRIE